MISNGEYIYIYIYIKKKLVMPLTSKVVDQILQNSQLFITDEQWLTGLAQKLILGVSNLVKLEPIKYISILFMHAM